MASPTPMTPPSDKMAHVMVFLAKDVDLRLASCQTAIDQALSVLGVPLVSPPADQPAQTVVERAKRLEASLCALEKALLPTDAELERQLAALEEESKQKAERMNKIQQVCGKLDKMVQDELKAQPAQPEEETRAPAEDEDPADASRRDRTLKAIDTAESVLMDILQQQAQITMSDRSSIFNIVGDTKLALSQALSLNPDTTPSKRSLSKIFGR